MKNKGFTMIELLIALCISSLVIELIFFIFIFNYNNFKGIRTMSELQFQAQYILNYMADKIINSKSISFVRADRGIYNLSTVRNAGTEYPLIKISFKYGNNLNENYVFHLVNNNIRYGLGEADMNASVELGAFVDSLCISLPDDCSFQNARVVIIKIVMKKDKQSFEAFQAVYMRNK